MKILILLLLLVTIGMSAHAKQPTVTDLSNVFYARVGDTGSMEPTLHANDRVLLAADADVTVDDVVAYQKNGVYVIHRVVRIGFDLNGWYAITKGDANQDVDEPVRREQIIGVMVSVE
jgi:signal peptidase I